MALRQMERLKERLLRAGTPSIFPRPLSDDPEATSMYARLRPVAEAMYLVIAADHVVDARERDAIRGALRTLTDGQLGGAAMDAMFEEFSTALARDGMEARLDAIASEVGGDPEDAELVVSLMFAAALASDGFSGLEAPAIAGLAERLRVKPDRLQALSALAAR